MSEKYYLNILKGGVFASFICLFFVFSGVLFPFISSKQISFNILIEILLLVLIFFLIQYPKYLPKKSYLSWALIAYFITIAMSLVVSVDFNLSFWGDAERMLGFFHLLHFLAFYFIIITVFRTKKDYLNLLNIFISSVVLVALYGILKNNPDTTLGNRAYVAALMIFALFLEVLFFLKSKEWWLKFIYSIAFVITFISFVKADISGSHLGLLFGIFTAILVAIFISKNKKIKILSLSSLIFLIALVSLLFAFRSHSVFDQSYLGKALRDFSSDNVTLNTRLISYKAAAKYLSDHPVSMIFGVGHGNYSLIFDKYFNPKFYDYDRGATYFDRAHNNIIDITTTTGIIGFLAYMSIFIVLAIYLIKSYQESDNPDKISKNELIILSALLVAYFVQNLAVFDSFATYLSFMVILAFINYSKIGNRADFKKEQALNISNNIRYFVAPFFVIILFLALMNNINSFSMLKKTIDAYAYTHKNGIIEGSKKYSEVFEYKTGLERDARESYINLALSVPDHFYKNVKSEEAEKALLLMIEQAEKNEKYNIYDSLFLSRLSRVYDLAGKFYFYKPDMEKSSYYSSLALSSIDRAIESSPGRVPLYLIKANLLLNFGEKEGALKEIEYARSLNEKMPEPYCQLAHFYFLDKNIDPFFENFKVCGDLKGFTLMSWGDFLSSVENYFVEKNDLNTLVSVYEIILSNSPDDINVLSKIASYYFQVGQFEKARESALHILEIDSNYLNDVNNFIDQIDLALSQDN